jgi:predicted permease
MRGALKRFWVRARATLSSRHDREVREELALHLQLMEEEYLAQGVAPDQARLRARREFGNPTLIQEASHDLFSFRPAEELARDLRYAAREARRSASFTCMAVGSLAIGIGAATATFAVIDAVMLRPLPVRAPERLIAFSTASDKAWTYWSHAAFVRWRHVPADLYAVAASSDVVALNMPSNGSAPSDDVRVALVSDNYFPVVGADIVLGRGFAAADAAARGSADVAIISDGFWRRRFSAAPDVLTKTIELGGGQYAIVGVARRGFVGHSVGYPSDVWVPLTAQPVLMPGLQGLDESAGSEARWLKIVGRLADGVSVDRAAAAAGLARQVFLTEKAARLGVHSPENTRDREERFRVVAAANGDTPVRARFERALTILAAITLLVLLVACTNFTNLMFARSEARRKEFAIRLALGGGRWRLVRQSAVECLGLATVAGVLSLLFATWATSMAMTLVTASEPVDFALELNARVLTFASCCALVAVAFGLWPSTRPVRSAEIASARRATDEWGAGPVRTVASRLILIVQLVVCTVLLIGAGLLLRTVINLRTQDLGYDREVLLMPLATERPGLSQESAPAVVERLREQLSAIPAVQAVGVSGSVLLDPSTYWVDGSQRLSTDGGVVLPGTQWTFAAVGRGFFEAVGMRLVSGRPFVDSPGVDAHEVVINQSLATFLFGEDDPVGRRLASSPRGPMQTIVGIVKDARQVSPRDRGLGVVYVPLRGFSRVSLAVRLADASPAAVASVRQQAGSLVGNLRAGPITTISEELDRAIARERLMTGIALFLTVLVVLIGSVGLYALMSYDVARRHRELGIRLALGATGGQLVTIVVRDAAGILIPALAIGLPLGVAVSRVLSSHLYGIHIGDPSILVTAGVLLSIVAMGAAFRPAWTASRIDPTALLRHE